MAVQKQIKCVVAGDAYTGKTCLLNSYKAKEYFPIDFTDMTSIPEQHCVDVVRNGQVVSSDLWDVGSNEAQEDRFRAAIYPGTQVVLLTSSFDSVSSFRNIRTAWLPEIKFHCPNVPIILVGTKIDLRGIGDSKKVNNEVTFTGALQLAKDIGAVKYLECSSRTMEGLDEVFNYAIDTVLNQRSL